MKSILKQFYGDYPSDKGYRNGLSTRRTIQKLFYYTKGSPPTTRMTLLSTANILAIFEGARSAAKLPQPDQESAHLLLTTAKTVLEQTLKEFIGTIANLICADHFRDIATLAATIDALAEEILNAQSAAQFREQARQRLN